MSTLSFPFACDNSKEDISFKRTYRENPFLDDGDAASNQGPSEYALPGLSCSQEPDELQSEAERTPCLKHRARDSLSPTSSKRVKFSHESAYFGDPEDGSNNELELFASQEPVDHTSIEHQARSVLESKPTAGIKTVRRSFFQPASRSIGKNVFCYAFKPPSTLDLLTSVDHFEIPNKIYTRPHYSDKIDAPPNLKEFGGLIFDVPAGQGLETLEDWEESPSLYTGIPSVEIQWNSSCMDIGADAWEYAAAPPTYRNAQRWINSDAGRASLEFLSLRDYSQIIGPTAANSYGMKRTPLRVMAAGQQKQSQHMSILSLEVFGKNLSLPMTGKKL
jgi:hypothetical protein